LPYANIISKTIPVQVEIPDFLVAPEPSFDLSTTKTPCLNFYYAVNRRDVNKVDIEFDIVDPSRVFGKSVIVDYVSSLDTTQIIVEPMPSNPYCLPRGSYLAQGYLYKPGILTVDTIDKSTEVLELR
jgi:hypothetical protein